MMKNLLVLTAFVASAFGATILYKDVAVQPYAYSTPHTLGVGITKQYGESIHDVNSAYPWYGQHNKEYLASVLSGPNYHHADIDTIGHWAAQLSGAQEGPFGTANYHTGPIGVVTSDVSPMVHVQQPFGAQYQGIHGIGEPAGSLYVGENGELLQGTHAQYPYGQHAVLVQGQHYPTLQVYPLHHIGAEGIEALKSHVAPYLTVPITGEMGHYNDADDLSASILYQKLHTTPYTSSSLLGQLTGQHGVGEYHQQFQVPLAQVGSVGPYGQSGVIGVQGKVWPSQIVSGVHPWYWNVANHHF